MPRGGTYVGGLSQALGQRMARKEEKYAIEEFERDVREREKEYAKMQKKIGGWQNAFSIASLLAPLAFPMLTASGLAGTVGSKLATGILGKQAVGKFATTALGKLLTKPATQMLMKTAVDTAAQQVGRKHLERRGKEKYGPKKLSTSSEYTRKAAEEINKDIAEGLEVKPWEGFKESFLTAFAIQGGMEALKKLRNAKALGGAVDTSVSQRGAEATGERIKEQYTTEGMTYGQKGTRDIAGQAVQDTQAWQQKFGGGDIAQRALPPTEAHKSYIPPAQYGTAGRPIFPPIPDSVEIAATGATGEGSISQQLMQNMQDNPEAWMGAGGTGGLLALLTLQNKLRSQRKGV